MPGSKTHHHLIPPNQEGLQKRRNNRLVCKPQGTTGGLARGEGTTDRFSNGRGTSDGFAVVSDVSTVGGFGMEKGRTSSSSRYTSSD
ncbi:hypothetical protein E3N88_22714 [Mikania micrantha]|uniref:Uncharacterized protein n=1 Tax=Mikania micrantha TaxID=192012 RepID=A0A5N6NCN1_9ASTR|nr:hypothetical protein E3N88_22714 [Mikania micrantha]